MNKINNVYSKPTDFTFDNKLKVFKSKDQRLFDIKRGQYYYHSHIPSNGISSIKGTEEVYSKKLNNYSNKGKHYSNYSQIKSGDITYYYTKLNYKPHQYSIPKHHEEGSYFNYIDPMLEKKPVHTVPVKYVQESNLSFIDDSNFQRNDIINRQQIKSLESRNINMY